MGFFDKLKSGLEKTKNAFFGQLNSMFRAFVKVDEDFLEELEDMLISADVGVETSEEIISELREKAKDDRLKSGEDVKNALRDILREKIGDGEALKLTTSPSVILVIGVNGVGKTTTIGKISARLADEGKKVVIAAADTFRAAAIDQLEVWCERSGAELIKQSEGSDPAAVVFDAAAAARKRRARRADRRYRRASAQQKEPYGRACENRPCSFARASGCRPRDPSGARFDYGSECGDAGGGI